MWRELALDLVDPLEMELEDPAQESADPEQVLASMGEVLGPRLRRLDLLEEPVDALAPYRNPSGAYRLENEWPYLVAAA